MNEWIAVALALVVIALILVALGLAWRHRSGRAARGIAAMGTRYNDYLGLGAHPEIPSRVSVARGERSGDDVTKHPSGPPTRRP